jgi:hypothetical protein
MRRTAAEAGRWAGGKVFQNGPRVTCRVRWLTAAISRSANRSATWAAIRKAVAGSTSFSAISSTAPSAASTAYQSARWKAVARKGSIASSRGPPRCERPRYFDEREKQNSATANTIAAPCIVR